MTISCERLRNLVKNFKAHIRLQPFVDYQQIMGRQYSSEKDHNFDIKFEEYLDRHCINITKI